MRNVKSGAGIAATIALLALSSAAITSTASAAGAETVHCYGVNSCKGTSDCKTAKNDCKAQNSCKGQGFNEMTAEQCTKAGGTLTETK